MDYDYDMCLVIHRETRRILTFTPLASFQPPTRIAIVHGSAVLALTPDDWDSVTWRGQAPTGFTAQTCYLFKLDSVQAIVEVDKPMTAPPVVL
jgi:hypothetical protein